MKFECPSLATLYDRRYEFFANQRGRKSRSIVKKMRERSFLVFFSNVRRFKSARKISEGKKKTRMKRIAARIVSEDALRKETDLFIGVPLAGQQLCYRFEAIFLSTAGTTKGSTRNDSCPVLDRNQDRVTSNASCNSQRNSHVVFRNLFAFYRFLDMRINAFSAPSFPIKVVSRK